MNICKDCQENLDVTEEEDFPFKASAILGGIGILSSLITGNLILVPLTLIAGSSIDIIRCDICGKEMEDSEASKILSVEQDEDEQYKFSSFSPDQHRVNTQSPQKAPASNRESHELFNKTPSQTRQKDDFMFQSNENPQILPQNAQQVFQYDDIQEKLAPIQAEEECFPDNLMKTPSFSELEGSSELFDSYDSSMEMNPDMPNFPQVPDFDRSIPGEPEE